MTKESAATGRRPAYRIGSRISALSAVIGLLSLSAVAAIAGEPPAARSGVPLRPAQSAGPGFRDRGDAVWVDAGNGTVPPDAVKGGHAAPPGGEPLYVCRGVVNHSLQPGKLQPGRHACSIPFAAAEVRLPRYQVLVGGGFGWVPVNGGGIPEEAVQGGNDVPPRSPPLFVCRARYKGGLHPGKTRRDWPGCDIGWGGHEILVNPYAVLVRIGRQI